MHDCTGACSHGRTNHHAVVVDVRIHDVDAGQGAVGRNTGFERLKREGRGGPMGLFGPRDPLDVRARDHAEHAKIRPPEGGDIGGMGLRGVTRGDDHVVERDEHAPARSLRIGRDANGVEKVEGPLGRKGRGGTHRAREHDGLFALHHQIEEERGLLHGVGGRREIGELAVKLRLEFGRDLVGAAGDDVDAFVDVARLPVQIHQLARDGVVGNVLLDFHLICCCLCYCGRGSRVPAGPCGRGS